MRSPDRPNGLKSHPLYLLGATTRDDRRRIVELAEDRLLEIDPEACQQARLHLTNPRTRLAAEMAWLPGVAPARARQLIEEVDRDSWLFLREAQLPPIATANLLADAGVAQATTLRSPDAIARFIRQLCDTVEKIEASAVARSINEDRTISGFPPVTEDQVAKEIESRLEFYGRAAKAVLDKVPSKDLVEGMTRVVDEATSGGSIHAPLLLDKIVDTYDVAVSSFLSKEADHAHKLIELAKSTASEGDVAVSTIVDRLEAIVRKWDRVAQPIQVSFQARGQQHRPSQNLAYALRDLSFDLYKNHKFLAVSERITMLAQELFVELPEVNERLQDDIRDLAQIRSDKDTWARDISYSVNLGTFFKKKFEISPQGVTFKNKHYPLDSITRLRWGATVHYTNGMYTGTTYTIGFGDDLYESYFDIKDQNLYVAITNRLYRAVGTRILMDTLRDFQNGRSVDLGYGQMKDEGISMRRRGIFSGNAHTFYPWSEITFATHSGSLLISAINDKKSYCELSYIYHANTHIINQILKMAFQRPGLLRLSELL